MTSSNVPRYLSDSHEPSLRVRCAIHGFIRYSIPERRIIDHPLFQRLRGIKQLAFTHYVYPGAMHSRFEHSLGVMELATQAYDHLLTNHSRILEENFASLPQLLGQPLAKARQLVRLMGLLHDIGHTPFSHAGDSILPGTSHERLSAWVVSPEGPLGTILDEEFFEGISELLSTMLLEKDVPPQLLVLKELVSGQLDVDRMDYLLRDSLHCGVEYGKFDYLRLISSLVVHINDNTRSLAIGIDRGGIHTFEALLLARYYMNTQVYYHRVRRAYDLLLKFWLEAWGSEKYQPMQLALNYDDNDLLYLMKQDSDANGDNPRLLWSKRIWTRNHPRMVFESDDHADASDLQRASRMLSTLKSEYPDTDLYLDDATGNVHKLFVRGDRDLADDLFIVDRKGQLRRFSEQSKIIEKIPKGFRMIRIYGYFTSSEQRDSVENRVVTLSTRG